MKKTIRTIVCILMAVMMLTAAAMSVSAAEGYSVNSNVPEHVEYVTAHYDVSKVIRNLQVPYSDDFFKMPSDQYSHILAQASMGLAVSAFRDAANKDAQDDNFISFAEQTGMSDIETTPYETEPETDSICYGIANKKIDDFTLVVIGVCGQGYGKEWASNLTIGTGTRSQGFNEAAQKVELGLYDYLLKYNIDGNIKIWISGYSRAGAVTNITAADLTDSGNFTDVYAYCFACPTTTLDPGNYNNIYNIMSKDDIVPKLPLPDWGFKRYGRDLYFKSAESDSDSPELTKASAELYAELTGSTMPINHEINSELRIVLDYLYMLFPDPETYVNELQDMVRGIFEGEEQVEVFSGFLEILNEYSAKNTDSSFEVEELIEYVQMLANKYFLSGNPDQKASGAWESGLGNLNFFNEHLADKYVSRIFAFDNPEQTFSDNDDYTRLVIYGEKLNINIETEESIVASVSADGNITSTENLGIYAVPYIAYYKNKVEITLPKDQTYWIYISSAQSQLINYIGIQFTDKSVRAKSGDFYSLDMKSNVIYNITVDESDSIISDGESSYTDKYDISGGVYSPSVIMRIDNSPIEGITISDVVLVSICVGSYLLIGLIVSIILKTIRKKKKRRRNAIMTILAHAVFIFIFAALENGTWYFIPEYKIVRTVIRCFVFLSLIILSYRAYKRYSAREWLPAFWITVGISIADLVCEYLLLKRRTGICGYIPVIVYTALFALSCFMWYMTYRKYEKFYFEPGERSWLDSQL